MALALILLLAVGQLRLQGRLWWCECGQAYLWSSETASRHNSQHLLDPYWFTHVLHGIVFYWALTWAFPQLRLDWRLTLAVLIEALWEILENTDFVIQRYRTATVSLDYYGDTIANSLADILAVVVGFYLARALGRRGSLMWFAATELVLLWWIRDSLLLNVVMLLCPIEAIKDWQLGGG